MEKVKVFLAALCAWLGVAAGHLGILVPLAGLLLAGNILDWVTGNAASAAEGQGVSSEKGRAGIAKKVGYWAEVLVCLGMDVALIYVVPSLHLGTATLTITAPIVAPTVCFWLVLNEALSIIENLGRMGVPVSPWLAEFITLLKSKADEKPGELGGDTHDSTDAPAPAVPKNAAHESSSTAAAHYDEADPPDTPAE